MDLSTITIADFKARFIRDFSFGNAPNDALVQIIDADFVTDGDIQNAFDEAKASLNQAVFGADSRIKLSYLLLTAHFVAQNILAQNGGLTASGARALSSRSVGNVSESYSIPQAYLDNPLLAMYANTSYGMRYLAMAMPGLVGNVVGVCGGTTP